MAVSRTAARCGWLDFKARVARLSVVVRTQALAASEDVCEATESKQAQRRARTHNDSITCTPLSSPAVANLVATAHLGPGCAAR